MATIDYKQKIKDYMNSSEVDTLYKSMLNNLFPELKDEDERIRKALKEYFINSFQNNGVAAICGIHIKDILAFLEKQGEQKPAWSEQDEKIYNLLYEEYKDRAYYSHSREGAEDIPGEILGWLKSLKDRVQPKQEWSEEDEKILNLIIARLHSHPNVEVEEYGKDYHWLNFLKERYTWKPNCWQIECLSDAIKHYNSLGYPATKLKELLADLKKLKA